MGSLVSLKKLSLLILFFLFPKKMGYFAVFFNVLMYSINGK